jgi:YVTN family beta-propeller protein
MFTKLKLAAIFVAASALLSSCTEESNVTRIIAPTGKYAKGIFILNEGQFGKPNGSVSFFNRKDLDSVAIEGDIFKKNNNRNLGDVVQSMTIVDSRAFIVVNNSNKVEIVDAGTFKSLAPEITLKSPRFAVSSNNKLYVTEYVGATYPAAAIVKGQVSVIDLVTYKVLKTIEVGKMPDKLLLANGKIYVANNRDNTISVINPNNDVLETTIVVADRPNGLVQDATGNIWVYCSGYSQYDETTPSNATLVKFNPSTPTTQVKLAFPTNGGSNLNINAAKTTLFYSYKGVNSMNTTATSLPTSPLIKRNFYGLGIDSDGTIYGSDALNYAVNGRVIRFNSNGIALDSMTVGLIPNGFIFR